MKQVSFITGASGDIGAATALRLAADGHALALLGYHNTKYLQELADACEAIGTSCIMFAGDLTDEDFVSRAVTETVERFGRVDNFVHAAGISEVGLLSDLPLAQWNRLLQTNLTSAYLCAKHLTPHMVRRQAGRILFISSVWGTRGASCEAAYSATKGGLDALTKALAKELAPSGIAVNALAPGMVDTKMNAAFSEEDIAAICEEIPAGRMTTPTEVADMTALLLDSPVYLTGQIIGFNGGWY